MSSLIKKNDHRLDFNMLRQKSILITPRLFLNEIAYMLTIKQSYNCFLNLDL